MRKSNLLIIYKNDVNPVSYFGIEYEKLLEYINLGLKSEDVKAITITVSGAK